MFDRSKRCVHRCKSIADSVRPGNKTYKTHVSSEGRRMMNSRVQSKTRSLRHWPPLTSSIILCFNTNKPSNSTPRLQSILLEEYFATNGGDRCGNIHSSSTLQVKKITYDKAWLIEISFITLVKLPHTKPREHPPACRKFVEPV